VAALYVVIFVYKTVFFVATTKHGTAFWHVTFCF